MGKYHITVSKSVTEFWEVEADSLEEAKEIYENSGMLVHEKEQSKDIDGYEG